MIEFEDAGFAYEGNALLKNMSVRIPPGSFYFLTGPSGAGKSTFLRLCYMELMPVSGLVQVFGDDVRSMNRDEISTKRCRIGVVHQDCQFLDHLSLEENVTLPLSVTERKESIDAQNVSELLNWVGLSGQKMALPPQLSGGERQRAALARAVIMDPDVILADEPTGNVDWEMSQRLMSLLVELNRLGKTIVLATHDMNLIRSIKSTTSTRVLRINQGTLQMAGADL